jgi:hypothetical protein
MGMPKAIRKQAITAERASTQAADTFVADQMKTLAQGASQYPEEEKEKEEKKK